jgi:ribonuclease HII
VAAAVVLPEGEAPFYHQIRDSKKLTAAQREALCQAIKAHALAWAIGVASAEEIDRLGILQATCQAMSEAVGQLSPPPDFLLVDGSKLPTLGVPQKSIINGDATCLIIAAASILAKVARDQLMVEAEREYPGYGFVHHKGYGTPQHLAAIRRLGPCPIHRRSFAPVQLCDGQTRENRRQKLGRLGERIALRRLKDLGYAVRETNYRSLWGEIDIVAQKDDCLSFVEVRTRTRLAFGSPEESITRAKGTRLIETAQAYMQTHAGLPEQWRIDLMAIELTAAGRVRRAELIENAIHEDDLEVEGKDAHL